MEGFGYGGKRLHGQNRPRMETETFGLVTDGIPELRNGVVEAVGKQFRGDVLCDIEYTEVRFILLPVPCFDEVQDAISDMKSYIDRLRDDVENARLLVQEKDAELQELHSKNERQRREFEAAFEKLSCLRSAYEEDKHNFIRAPELVSSLQSLSSEIRDIKDETIQVNKLSSERQREKIVQEKKQLKSQRQWNQVKRLLHDIKRVRRRKSRNTNKTPTNWSPNKTRQRLCYKCRQKGHETRHCQQEEPRDESVTAITLRSAEVEASSSVKQSEEIISLTLEALSQFCGLYRAFPNANEIVFQNGMPCLRLIHVSSDETEYYSDQDDS